MNDAISHYENRRIVDTPSYDQVRRPIYGSSIGKWRLFGGPLEEPGSVLSAGAKGSIH